MILAAVDDLMLASKIRQAGARAGAAIVFVRSASETLERLRKDGPTLAIFDLNSVRLEPLDTMRRMKADAALSAIPAIAFVSHVEADLIAAARLAGFDRVLARAAFFEQLPGILADPHGGHEKSDAVTVADIERARRRIAPHVRRTPLIESAWLSDVAHADVRLKLESLQVTNSFKARGAVNLALALRERLQSGAETPTIVTASAGNAGRAFAYAGERLGLRTVVFTPRDAPRTKLDAIRRHGAELHDEAETYEDAERLAKRYAADHDLAYTSPYSHPDLIAGFGTLALEVFEDFPEVDVFVVPVGGGGLISGVGIAAHGKVRVVGVEAEASHPFATSIREGRITEVAVGPTVADGLAGNMDPETITFDLVRRYVDELVQASEDDLLAGIRGLVAREHLIAEGAGVAGVAAALGRRANLEGRHVAIVVSGANIDVDRLRAILAR